MNRSFTYSNAIKRLSNSSDEVWAIHDKACERLNDGEDIILLSIGDPDLSTLDETINHTIDSLKNGRTHYSASAGEIKLRQTISDIETKSSGKPCTAEEVIIYPGATNALYCVLSSLLNEGDEIVVPEPMYIGYLGIFDCIGASVVSVPLNTENNFSINVAAIKLAITEKTKVLFLNTPGNPAGNIIPAAILQELAEYCFDRGIWVLCDEVYSMITYEQGHTSMRKAASRLDNIIVVDGLSKSHAMTGWRLGWSVAPAEVSAKLLNFAASTIFGCCQFIQDAATFALINDEAYMQEIRHEYKARRDYIIGRLQQIPQLICTAPQAGMFLMVDVSKVAVNGYQFAEELLAHEGVSVLPGIGFGASTNNFVRISLTVGVDILATAMDRIENYIFDQFDNALIINK